MQRTWLRPSHLLCTKSRIGVVVLSASPRGTCELHRYTMMYDTELQQTLLYGSNLNSLEDSDSPPPKKGKLLPHVEHTWKWKFWRTKASYIQRERKRDCFSWHLKKYRDWFFFWTDYRVINLLQCSNRKLTAILTLWVVASRNAKASPSPASAYACTSIIAEVSLANVEKSVDLRFHFSQACSLCKRWSRRWMFHLLGNYCAKL